jgi:virginiamycin A acetyltransferase
MNEANHQMNSVSTFLFYTLEGWEQTLLTQTDLPIKGEAIIGNDVWVGQNATILAGVHIGDGAIIGANSVVGSNVEPYTIVVGNLAKVIRKRFDDELIEIMEKLKWWDKSIEEINNLISLLTNSNLEYVKGQLKKLL